MAQTKEEIAAYNRAYYLAHHAERLEAKRKADEKKRLARSAVKRQKKPSLRTPADTVARKRAWYLEKREAIVAKRKEKYKRSPNHEKERARSAAYRKANRAKIAAKDKAYRAANREKMRVYDKNRYAQKVKNGGKHTVAEWNALCDWFGNVCLCCGTNSNLSVDHVIPTANGGTDDITNIQPLCVSCNSAKMRKETDYRDPKRLDAFLAQLTEQT